MAALRGRQRDLLGAPTRSVVDGPFRERYSIAFDGGSELDAKGNIVDHEYTIERRGDTVAQISKRWFSLRDTYGIEIADAQDDALIVAITVCIDQISHNTG